MRNKPFLIFCWSEDIIADCLELAIRGDCAVYLNCMESMFKCGADGYFVSYGLKYCNRFKQEKHFSEKVVNFHDYLFSLTRLPIYLFWWGWVAWGLHTSIVIKNETFDQVHISVYTGVTWYLYRPKYLPQVIISHEKVTPFVSKLGVGISQWYNYPGV